METDAVTLVTELVDALKELKATADRYSDSMARSLGCGHYELGALVTEPTSASGQAGYAIRRAQHWLEVEQHMAKAVRDARERWMEAMSDDHILTFAAELIEKVASRRNDQGDLLQTAHRVRDAIGQTV